MKNRNRYDDIFDDGLGMDELIGRHLKNYANRSIPPLTVREQLFVRAQEQQSRSPVWIWIKAYLRTIGSLLWLIISLRWLEADRQDYHLKWINASVLEDYELNQWLYYRSTMSSFLFGSGNFTLSG